MLAGAPTFERGEHDGRNFHGFFMAFPLRQRSSATRTVASLKVQPSVHMPSTTTHDPVPASVRQFLETVVHWPINRWQRACTRSDVSASASRRAVALVLRDAILAVDGLKYSAWFVQDAARTASEMLPTSLPPHTRATAAQLLVDASLALLARPQLPATDLASLLSPFLPLYIVEV